LKDFKGLKGKMGMKYSDITEKIIGCAMKVHRGFGFGFTHGNNDFFMVFVNASHFRNIFIKEHLR